MAQDKYKAQLTLIKGGKLKKNDAPEEYMALCGELAGCLLEFIQHEVGIAEFSRNRKKITEKMEEYENTIAGESEVEKLEPPTFASDEEEAEWYRERAERGNPFAQEQLGDMYSEGRGVPEDDDQAEEWWRKAAKGYRQRAEKGDAESQNRLGELYRDGRGVPGDVKQAMEWYRKAAEQGQADAPYRLGLMYNYGALKDEEQAAEWYRKAAEQGHVDAQYRLGMMYNRGRGVPKDIDQAEEWLGKVADAYCNRAKLQDDADALKQLRQLAELGWANAQYNWGVLAETGFGGVHQNIMHAISWYRKAAKRGHEKAKEALERLSS